MGKPTKGRMLNRDISNSHHVAALSERAAVLFFMIIPHLNSYGKMNGGTGFIKDEICPFIPYLTFENIPELLIEISEHTNMKYWCADRRCWIHAIHFLTDHQQLNPLRLGADSLPSWPGEINSGLKPDLNRISPVSVRHEVEVEVEGEGEDKEEGEVEASNARGRQAIIIPESFTAQQIRESVAKHAELLSRKYPCIDLELQTAQIIAKYGNQSIGADPSLIVLRWFEKLKPNVPDKAESVREANHRAAREFVES